jgi:hypothetical protein
LEEENRAANIPGAEVVLVRSESIEALRRAYPNYFLDTELFLQRLDEIMRLPRARAVARRRS